MWADTNADPRERDSDMRAYLVLSLLVVFSAPAHAYIDAGSGSYMLQMALAGVMALVFSAKMYWHKLKSYATGLYRSRGSAEPGSTV